MGGRIVSRLKLGIVLETTGLPVRSALAAAAKLGVAGVQLDAVGDLAPDRLTATGRRDFRNVLKSYNLELSALRCPLRRGLDAIEHQQQRIEHVRTMMQLAFDLGPRVVVTPLPRIPSESDATSPRAVALGETLRDLGGFGDRVGVRLALEGGLDAGEKVRDYLLSFDSGGLACNFDPANFLFHGHDPLANLTSLGGLVIHTHARDGRAATISGGPQEVPVGAGTIEWMLYIATLESLEYHGYLVVDREQGEHRFADVTAGVQFLRRFVT